MKKKKNILTAKEILFDLSIMIASFCCIALTLFVLMMFIEAYYNMGYLSCLSKTLPVLENLTEATPEKASPDISTFTAAMGQIKALFDKAIPIAEKKFSSISLCVLVFATSGFMFLMGMINGAKVAKEKAKKEISSTKEDVPNDIERLN